MVQHTEHPIASSTSSTAHAKRGNLDDAEYQEFLTRFNMRFLDWVQSKRPLFTTDATGLWEAYLAGFAPEVRQFHNCNACRHFIERFGGLVTLAPNGRMVPALWDFSVAPSEYQESFVALDRIVSRAKVTGVFLSSKLVWGQPETGAWRHFALIPPPHLEHKHATMSADQAMAEKRVEHGVVMRALADFPAAVVDQALTLLRSEALYRSEKVLGQAEWLSNLHAAVAAAKGKGEGLRSNVVWAAVATAPAGFCHPRSSMIGSLLEDIASGLSFADVERKFRSKMDPLHYQRPQAPPSAGNIAQAEKLVAELGAAGSLARRYARLDELQTIWRPSEIPAPAGGGVFSHLKPKENQPPAPLSVPAQPITWEKFARTALPEAKAIDVFVPSHGNFAGIVTAENLDAPPILQWDSPEQRNPFSWYVYHGGSSASRWSLRGSTWVRVNAVTLRPSMWFGGKLDHQGEGAVFVLNGAKDIGADSCGNALFPETLKAEFRSVRSTIESYSRSAKLGGVDAASANGLAIQKGGGCDVHVRVTLGNGTRVEYKIDRWD